VYYNGHCHVRTEGTVVQLASAMCERAVPYERQRLCTELWPRAYVTHDFLCCVRSLPPPSYSLHNNNVTSLESNETRCQGGGALKFEMC